MRRARAYTNDTGDVGFAVTGRTEPDLMTMTDTGSPGPQIRERRPKAQRPCLGCNRTILTTCASRLCRPCLLWAADLRGGVDETHLPGALTQTERAAVGA